MNLISCGNAVGQQLSPPQQHEGKYLAFSMDSEEYGIGILTIREIIGMMRITPLPQTPQYVKGVINLRGKVIPVVDLRIRFGIPSTGITERSCIIVVEIRQESTPLVMGIIVDSVSEVMNLKASDIEATPGFGRTMNTEYILGMAKAEGRVKILLDIDRVLSADELVLLNSAA